MNEKIKPIWDKVKGFFGGLSKAVKIALAVILAVAVVVIAGLVIHNATKPYAVLYTEMNEDDMRQVLAYLGNNNITDFKTRGNDTILVPEGQADALKAKLAMEGYPSSGFAYGTYFNNVGILSSQSDRTLLEKYELQDRLAATIEWFDGVRKATVDISLGEDNRYILDREDAIPATAAVVVTMKGNNKLTDQQASAIRNLVARSVSGLSFDEVGITDTAGNEYVDSDAVDEGDASALKLFLEKQVSKTVRGKVMDVLTPLFGEKNVSVSVTSTVDVSRSWSESTQYSSPDDTSWNSLGGHGLIGEFVYDNRISRDGDQAAGGVPGTTTNSDLSEYMTNPGNLTGNEQELGSSGSVTYHNNQTTTQRQSAGGVVTDVTVAVSVNSAAIEGNVNVLDLVSHVGRAAGIPPEIQNSKISVLTWPFYEEPEPEPEPLTGLTALLAKLPDWVLYAIIGGTILFLFLLVLLLALGNKRKKRKAAEQEALAQAQQQEQEAQDELAAIAAMDFGVETEELGDVPEMQDGQGAQIMDLQSDRTMELRKDVREFAEQNPEIAAQMVKAWLKGGEEHA